MNTLIKIGHREVGPEAANIQHYQANLSDELEGAALYEHDPIRKDLFLQLAQAERSHAGLCREKLAAAGVLEKPAASEFYDRDKHPAFGDLRHRPLVRARRSRWCARGRYDRTIAAPDCEKGAS